jgi:hypothetical protein
MRVLADSSGGFHITDFWLSLAALQLKRNWVIGILNLEPMVSNRAGLGADKVAYSGQPWH